MAGIPTAPVNPAMPPIVSPINVTAPLRAKALPESDTPFPIEMDARAMMFPANEEVVPRVADVPICQKTLEACARLIRTTVLLVAVVSAVPIWKMNWPF